MHGHITLDVVFNFAPDAEKSTFGQLLDSDGMLDGGV
jgi:hypothetical protein